MPFRALSLVRARGRWPTLTAQVAAAGLLTAVLLAAVPGRLAAQDATRVRIAVVDLRNATSSGYWGPRLGEAAADELATQLVQAGVFRVIERSRLKSLLAEQKLGQSGAVDPRTAAEIGKLLGVQAVVTGSITKFSVDTKGGGIGPISASYSEADAALDLRVVNVNTGEILLAVEGEGTKRFGGVRFEDINFEQDYDAGLAQESLRPAVEQAVERLVASSDQLASVPPPATEGQVVGTNEGNVYIDRGENFGIEEGQRFDVYRVVDEIRDGEGNLLDEVTEQVGVIEVTRVLSQSSVCRIVEGEAGEGDTFRARESGGG